jgi:phosphate-selective porin OprO/OprP
MTDRSLAVYLLVSALAALVAARAGAEDALKSPPLRASFGAPVAGNPSEDLQVSEPAGAKGEAVKPASGDESSSARFNLREGFVGETADKAFRYHVGGRFDWDSGWYRVPANVQQSLDGTPLLDGTDLRRFRLMAEGTVWEQLDFKIEADFSRASDFTGFHTTPQTNIFITHAWVALRDLPLIDTLRAGHQKEYLTFANATSANVLPFMERPYIFDAFENPFSFDSGVSMNRSYFDGQVTSWIGAFWNGTRSQAFNVGGHYAVSGRVTWMPIYDEDQQRWLCLSTSGSVRSFQENDPNSIEVRPLVRTGQSFDVPDLLHTGAIFSRDGLEIFGGGAHSAWGPLTLGGEFLCWSVRNAYTGSLPNPDGSLPPGSMSVGDLFYSGFYVEALCFLTPGDHRSVDRVIPSYERVRPVRNFLWRKQSGCNGTGAWEIGVRYDHIDLNSGLLRVGRMDSLTVGLNWYLNPNTRFTVNYVWTQRNTGDPAATGSFDALGARVHFDF